MRLCSQTLLRTGSRVFAEMLSPAYQKRIRRRKRLLRDGLPLGIFFVVDLAPPTEGDEAVAAVAALWCSEPVRRWKPAGRGVFLEPDDGIIDLCPPVSRELDLFFHQTWGSSTHCPEPPPPPPVGDKPAEAETAATGDRSSGEGEGEGKTEGGGDRKSVV